MHPHGLSGSTERTIAPPGRLWEIPVQGEANEPSIAATARINPGVLGGAAPANTGTVKLLEIETSNALVALRYSAGDTIDGRANDTGYFFEAAAFGGAAARTEKVIATGLATSTWTNVKLPPDPWVPTASTTSCRGPSLTARSFVRGDRDPVRVDRGRTGIASLHPGAR